MRDRILDIETTEGKMETFISHPEQGGPFPWVILYQDFWGVREELYDIARMVAVTGYYVMVPDLFYRTERRRSDYRDENNRMISSWKLAPEVLAFVAGPIGEHKDDMAMRDTQALMRFVRAGEPVKADAFACFGYCLGGRLALKAAIEFPDACVAAASMHGTALVTPEPDSAHLGVAKIKAELYFGFAEHDHWATSEMIATLEAALQASGIAHTQALHRGAMHGYALPNRDIFDKPAYNRDWELIFAMLHRRLPASFVDG